MAVFNPQQSILTARGHIKVEQGRIKNEMADVYAAKKNLENLKKEIQKAKNLEPKQRLSLIRGELIPHTQQIFRIAFRMGRFNIQSNKKHIALGELLIKDKYPVEFIKIFNAMKNEYVEIDRFAQNMLRFARALRTDSKDAASNWDNDKKIGPILKEYEEYVTKDSNLQDSLFRAYRDVDKHLTELTKMFDDLEKQITGVSKAA